MYLLIETSGIEDFLNKNVEAGLGKIINFINKTDLTHHPFQPSAEFVNTAKMYLCSLISKGQGMLENINRNSMYFQFLPEQTKHDLTVKHTIEEAVNQDLSSDYLVTFMLNCSSVPFVLPMSGAYSYGIGDLICANLPITPMCSIVMVNFEG